jgi:hypothetical protein
MMEGSRTRWKSTLIGKETNKRRAKSCIICGISNQASGGMNSEFLLHVFAEP